MMISIWLWNFNKIARLGYNLDDQTQRLCSSTTPWSQFSKEKTNFLGGILTDQGQQHSLAKNLASKTTNLKWQPYSVVDGFWKLG